MHLLPAVAPGVSQLQSLAAQCQARVLLLYHVVSLRGFRLVLDNVFLLTAGLTAIGVPLALLLPRRQRRSAAAPVARME